MLYKRILFTFLFLSVCSIEGFAQRYNFEQYDIEDGLTQSQVTAITQDGKRRLWMTTLGGVSCFNGKQFTNYTKVNGLSSNFALAIAADKRNRIYIGSSWGLSRYNGYSFYNYNYNKNWIGKMISDKSGNVFYLRGKRLFKVTEDNEQLIPVTDDPKEAVTAIKADPSGRLWAAVFNSGIYYFESGKWHSFPSHDNLKDLWVTDLLADRGEKNKIWLLSEKGVFIVQNGITSRIHPEIPFKCNAIAQDAKGAIWIGTNSGAYYITPAQITHFNSKNGFTDNVVNEIFRDIENNIWLGTDGSGLFRFNNNSYVTFDETQGINSRIVMALARGPKPGSIWMGSYGGLYEYVQNQKIKSLVIPSENKDSYRINFLYRDKREHIWIGTPGGGLWMYDGKSIIRVDDVKERIAYNSIIEDSKGTIWLSTNMGVITYDPVTKERIRITSQFGGSLLEMGRDSIISGTQDGAWLISNQQKAVPMNIKALNGSSILCMLRDKDYILFGTADYGLIIWNHKTGKTKSLNSKSGLAADHIYSLLKDKRGTIWVGTGRGINRLNSADYSVISTNSEDSPLVECNQNAILQYNNNVWIGTTKGVIAFGLDPSAEKKINPYIFINSVSVFPNYEKLKNTDTSKFSYKEHELNKAFVLPYNHNHINISFTGIHLANPNDLLYQYRLIGLDNKYSQPGSSSSMSFTSIPPGKYTFQARAVTRDGLISLNTASFSFEIKPPYYQTNIFRFLMVILIILVIMLAVYVILTLNERKRKLRLKIKLEEQFKIRKQTAEDFHDDLGNKLTRITVLSEVLSSMIDQNDTEKRNILKKISTNVDELYTGTKDILWSLNPKNDTLIQLLDHIREFGTEMFNDTAIVFKSDIDVSKDTKLSLDLSRNMLMIFKESINNVLKHSKAKNVNYHAKLNNDVLLVTLEDDGNGFDTEYGKNGHGINNMYVRAKRINADLNITSGQRGTTVCLIVKFPTSTHLKNV